jgi:putative endopeptidase
MNPIDRANMNTEEAAGNNFYEFCNGNWVKNNPVPSEYSRWGLFEQLHENGLAKLHSIVLEDANKTGAFFSSAMNVEKINDERLKPLGSVLTLIDSLEENKHSLGAIIGALHSYGISALFGFGAGESFMLYIYDKNITLSIAIFFTKRLICRTPLS